MNNFLTLRLKEELYCESFVNDVINLNDSVNLCSASLINESCDDIFLERARVRKKKVYGKLTGALNKIIEFVKGLFTKVKNKLSRNDILNDFKGSRTEKYYLNYDMNRKIKEANSLMGDGNKVIDSIRKGTPITKASYEAFKLRAKNFCDNTPTLAKVGAGAGAVAITATALFSHRKNILNAFNKVTDNLNKCKSSVMKMPGDMKLKKEVNGMVNKMHDIETKNKQEVNNMREKMNKIGNVIEKEKAKKENTISDESIKTMSETISLMGQMTNAFGRISIGFANIVNRMTGGNKNE